MELSKKNLSLIEEALTSYRENLEQWINNRHLELPAVASTAITGKLEEIDSLKEQIQVLKLKE